MMMCGCKTCNEMDRLHESMQIKQRKIISETETKIKQMPRGRAQMKLERELEKHKDEVLTAKGDHKHDKGWDVADLYGCRERITVHIDSKDVSFPHFSCILGKCKSCDKKDYQAPQFELNRTQDSIRYSLFNSHSQCSIHKCQSIEYHEEKPYV